MRYMTGYNGTTRDLAGLLSWSHWQNLDSEMQRRTLAILDDSYDNGTPLGIGSIFRTTEGQTALFLSRHRKANRGCCYWEGSYYELLPGMAHAAPPGRSYHEATTREGKAVAIDFTGALSFLHTHAKAYGFIHFAKPHPLNEPWHAQPFDVPSAKRDYHPGTVLQAIVLPKKPVPAPVRVMAPKPTQRNLSPYNDKQQVRDLQHILNWLNFKDSMNRTLVVDGDYGPRTTQAVVAMQLFFKTHFDKTVAVDGIYGPHSARLLQNFLDGLAALNA